MERQDIDGKTKETWMHVCEQAAIQQDPDKLLELVKEKENRLQRKQEEQGGGEGCLRTMPFEDGAFYSYI